MEQTLETSFAPFGKILKVEIDKKKGFGYMDFAEPEGLQKAIAASPISVAQSQVVVLERKANPGAERSRGKGRSEAQPANSSGSNSCGGKSGGSEATSGGKSSRGPRGDEERRIKEVEGQKPAMLRTASLRSSSCYAYAYVVAYAGDGYMIPNIVLSDRIRFIIQCSVSRETINVEDCHSEMQ